MEIIKKILLLIILVSLHNCNGQEKKNGNKVLNTTKQNSTSYYQQKIISKNEDSLKFGFTDFTIQLKQKDNFDYSMLINNKVYETKLMLESANVNVWIFKNTDKYIILVEADDYYGSSFNVYTYINKNVSHYGNIQYDVKDAENNKEEKKIKADLTNNFLNLSISQNKNISEFNLKKEKEIQQLNVEMSNSENNDFNIVKKYKSDINQDKKPDEIIVYGTDWAKEIKPTDFKKFKIVINLSENSDYKTFVNDKIIEPYYPENVASGFSDVKIKDNYFTIEQTNGGGGIIVRSYTTFKYDMSKKSVMLHKLSTVTTEQSSGDEIKNELTTKNFGNIYFENFNPNNLNAQ